MINPYLNGLGTALITPFKADLSVDYEALGVLVERQIKRADYLVVLGTTGEAATLTEDERIQISQFIIHKVNGRMPLILGMGGNNTTAIIDTIKRIDLSAFTAILSVCPYYNKPNQEGLYQHFMAIAQASPLPVILYNVPGRTGVNLLPETVIRLKAMMQNKILGIKEASGNIEQIKHLIALKNESEETMDLLVISGDDGLANPLAKAGAQGLISVLANAFPADVKAMLHPSKEGEDMQHKYDELIRLLFSEGNPTGIKALLANMNLISNYLRLPLVPASNTLQTQLEQWSN